MSCASSGTVEPGGKGKGGRMSKVVNILWSELEEEIYEKPPCARIS